MFREEIELKLSHRDEVLGRRAHGDFHNSTTFTIHAIKISSTKQLLSLLIPLTYLYD